MPVLISDGYIRVQPAHAKAVARVLAEAWKDPRLPMEQFRLAVEPELKRYRQGLPVEPYDSAIAAFHQIPIQPHWTVLDAGAGSGFYAEVFWMASVEMRYCGVEFSRAFVDFGRSQFPDIELNVGDVRHLDAETGSVDVVFSSGCLMHIYEYADALREMARVARRYVILNRTPVLVDDSTTFFVKRAYGVPCLEVHFNEAELHRLIEECGLKIVAIHFSLHGHRAYVLQKP